MSQKYSMVIRGGTVVDGSGGEPFEADVALQGDRIVAIGPALAQGGEEINAKGKLVTPGFVDPHTHYDAQVTWSSRITPTSWNGVTTAMMGNCGVGFAPCKPEQRNMLVELMEGVEDIPEVVLTAGLPWNWESFEEYLDVLDERRFDIDIAAQVPHAALRVYVMGQRGADREPATTEDRRAMATLAAAGIKAGALGFSTSRTLNHRTVDGRPTPTLNAGEAELSEIGEAIGRIGEGWMQVISDFNDPADEMAMLQRVVSKAGRPMAITILQRDSKPEGWRELMRHIADARASGLDMKGQVIGRPTGVLLGFEISMNPFSGKPSWEAIAQLPLAEKMTILQDPQFRERLINEDNPRRRLVERVAKWDRIFPLNNPPNYEPSPDQSVAAMAVRERRKPEEVAYDLLLENEGRAILYRPLSNYAHGNLDTVHEMITRPDTLVSLGDGGAHVGTLSDASATTYFLTHWTRDRSHAKVPLPWAIKRLSRDNALALGLSDRGLLKAGLKADLNVIDYAGLGLHSPEVVYDLPAGGRRLIQRTKGYDATILSGQPVYRDGKATDLLPGRLVRGAR
ncbi:MAG: amidohydrolase family protein [Chromatiales bacterium]|jgi:N-acyl-D-aspartate/D-glutamate deacylase|nr:amidohydrolase family protein [Chromatiales bacterium]